VGTKKVVEFYEKRFSIKEKKTSFNQSTHKKYLEININISLEIFFLLLLLVFQAKFSVAIFQLDLLIFFGLSSHIYLYSRQLFF